MDAGWLALDAERLALDAGWLALDAGWLALDARWLALDAGRWEAASNGIIYPYACLPLKELDLI
ncbi:hypothetical protein [Sporosarcina sp. UB5]|uniref:hypothetical protein n=1 Tax=Sporosarcina sp. UB5 TaxID=3047463 RepID=UPI003D7AA3C7